RRAGDDRRDAGRRQRSARRAGTERPRDERRCVADAVDRGKGVDRIARPAIADTRLTQSVVGGEYAGISPAGPNRYAVRLARANSIARASRTTPESISSVSMPPKPSTNPCGAVAGFR